MIQGPAESNEPLELAPESNPAPPRFRAVPPHGSEAPPEPETRAKREPRPDFFTRFLDQPRWEQYAAAAATACLLGWLGASGWNYLYALGSPGGWFFTFTLIGSLTVIALAVAGTSRWMGMNEKTRRRTLAAFATLPALGGAIELLQHFWSAIAISAAVAMAYAAIRLLLDSDPAA